MRGSGQEGVIGAWRYAFIVFDDADLDVVVAAAIVCKFRNSGQTCVSANRILVQAGIYDASSQRFAKEVEAPKVADGFAEGAQVRPLIDRAALGKVEEHVADAVVLHDHRLARTWRLGEALEYGILGVNTGIISTEVAPFGGMKESGIGREGSSLGVDDWLELKYWALGGLT